jgi:hypothetical protein
MITVSFTTMRDNEFSKTTSFYLLASCLSVNIFGSIGIGFMLAALMRMRRLIR